MKKSKDTIQLKPLLIVSATQQSDINNTRIGASIKMLNNQAKLVGVTENYTGLPEIYNKYMTRKISQKHDIVVFAHDDLYIDDAKLRGKLYKAMFIDKYDIVGLAGAQKCSIKSPALWHLMSEKQDWSGAVYHPAGMDQDSNEVISTSFGPVPKRCLILDGVFLAVNLRTVKEKRFKFNTNFDFHHYDIASCLDANEKGMKMGTALIHAIHDSPGLASVEDPQWKASEQKFLELYG